MCIETTEKPCANICIPQMPVCVLEAYRHFRTIKHLSECSFVVRMLSSTAVFCVYFSWNMAFFTHLVCVCQAPDMSNVAEFKKGFIMRKCCIDPDGRKSESAVANRSAYYFDSSLALWFLPPNTVHWRSICYGDVAVCLSVCVFITLM